MRHKVFVIFIMGVLLSPSVAFAVRGHSSDKSILGNDDGTFKKQVFVKGGNVFLKKDGKTIQLTTEGNCRAPVFSPTGKNVIFIRKSKEIADDLAAGDPDENKKQYADEVWVVNFKELKPRLLASQVPSPEGRDPGKSRIQRVCDDKMAFSPDGKSVYFLTDAWVTSCAVDAANIDGTGVRYVTDGSSLRVVMRGKYEGYLVVEKHRYFIGGGSYNFAWLVTPSGKEIGPVGEQEKAVNWDVLETVK
ncbi:MAG: PD40 domain-containing protein [Candidatus Omnitrophica bacterium]|nr:PD40 domain-containing protein [Candidatus Omnitrophota bacterium]